MQEKKIDENEAVVIFI